MDLRLDVRERDGATVVAASGELDLSTAPRLRELAVARLTAGAKVVVLDLSEVEFLDSTGLGILVAILKRARSLDAQLALVITRERIRKVFDLTGLATTFPIHEDLDAALASIGP